MSTDTFRPQFVDEIPEQLEDGVLYISIPYATTVHRCASGCGRETVNPLSPAQWSLTYDGANASLSPSIGNWAYPCHAHYWIRNGQVLWAPPWTATQIAAGHAADQQVLDDLYDTKSPARPSRRQGWLSRLLHRRKEG